MQPCTTSDNLSKSYFYLKISPIGKQNLNKCRKVLSPRFDIEFTIERKSALCSRVEQVNTFLNHIFI